MALLLILVVLPASILLYQWQISPRLSSTRIIDIVASVPEAGGFQPNSIQVEKGETVTLRFRSADVTHGVAIGPALGIDLGTIEPGHVKEVTVTFDKAGTYTFYCNTWCSVNHWRMRGIIDVSDPQGPTVTPQHDAVIEALARQGINIDDQVMENMTPTPAVSLLARKPSSARGMTLVGRTNIPVQLRDINWQHTHTPLDALDTLANFNQSVSRDDLADVVAYLWIGNLAPNALNDAAAYYAKNCAACHGENGDGKGPIASQTVKVPASFNDFSRMFARRDDVLYAKIRRGGMGTDMPNFGTLLTPEETWSIVRYLRTFALEGK